MSKPAVSLGLLLLSTLLAAEPLPIEYFVKDGDYLDVSLSPSGKHLAARLRANDVVGIIIIDRATQEAVGGARPASGNAIHTVEWINNERLLFSYAEERVNLDAPVSTGELFGINFDGTHQQLLAGFRASDANIGPRVKNKDDDLSSFYLVNTLENDDKHILVIEYPWSKDGRYWYDNRVKLPVVSRLDVYSGRMRKIEALPFRNATPYSTNEGEIRFVTYEDAEGNWAAAFRESNAAEWQTLAENFDLAEEMTVVGLNDAGDTAFLRGTYGEDGFYTIYRLDFRTKTAQPLFTDLDADIVDWLADPASGEIVAGKSMRGKPRYHYAATDSEIGNIHRKLTGVFAGQAVDIVSATRDGAELMLRVSSDTNPGEYYLFNAESKKAEFFWANLSWIDPRQMRPVILDEVATEDGYTLPVRLTLPEDDNPAPLIVFPHGGPHNVADVWTFDRDVQLLANRGYAVLQVNFRGSGYFGEDFQQAGYREWGGTEPSRFIGRSHRGQQGGEDFGGSKGAAPRHTGPPARNRTRNRWAWARGWQLIRSVNPVEQDLTKAPFPWDLTIPHSRSRSCFCPMLRSSCPPS
jgi:dipeptidyl aminopeptidase/acylaminoacyl peptidase